jgi:NADH dehydrogenase
MFEKIKVSGYFAWLAWLGIHIAFLIGFRSRIAVMFNWAYAYLTFRRHAQLIIGEGPTGEQAQPALTESGEHARLPLENEQRDSLHSSLR